jgi:hypothetical protein
MTQHYIARWNESKTDSNDPADHLSLLNTLATEHSLKPHHVSYKAWEDGSKTIYEGDRAIEELDTDISIDNVKAHYTDRENTVDLEYDAGSFGAQYRLTVTGDSSFREAVEDRLEQEVREMHRIDNVPVARATGDMLRSASARLQDLYSSVRRD